MKPQFTASLHPQVGQMDPVYLVFLNASPFRTGAYAQQTPCQRKIHLDNVLPWRERDRLSMASAVQSAHKDIN